MGIKNNFLAIILSKNGTGSKFGTHKELKVLNIKSITIVLLSHVICHVAILLRRVFEQEASTKKNIFLIHITYFEHFTSGMSVYCKSIKFYEGKHHFKYPSIILNHSKL